MNIDTQWWLGRTDFDQFWSLSLETDNVDKLEPEEGFATISSEHNALVGNTTIIIDLCKGYSTVYATAPYKTQVKARMHITLMRVCSFEMRASNNNNTCNNTKTLM